VRNESRKRYSKSREVSKVSRLQQASQLILPHFLPHLEALDLLSQGIQVCLECVEVVFLRL